MRRVRRWRTANTALRASPAEAAADSTRAAADSAVAAAARTSVPERASSDPLRPDAIPFPAPENRRDARLLRLSSRRPRRIAAALERSRRARRALRERAADGASNPPFARIIQTWQQTSFAR